MSTERDERGWAVELSEFMNYASQERRGRSVEVSVDPDGIEVRIEEGSGYMSQSCSATIPIDILIRLMQRNGYRVERE